MPIPSLSPAEENTRLKKELEWAYLKIRVLEERLRLQRIEKYGPASEKLTDAQLELLEGEPGVHGAEVEAESRREPIAATTPSPNTGSGADRRRHPGRQTLPVDLPRVERIIPCTPEQCICKGCDREKSVIGYEEKRAARCGAGTIFRGGDPA